MNIKEVSCFTTSPSVVCIYVQDDCFEYEYFVSFLSSDEAWAKGMTLKQSAHQAVFDYLATFDGPVTSATVQRYPDNSTIQLSYKRMNEQTHQQVRVQRHFPGYNDETIQEGVAFFKSLGNDILEKEDEIRMMAIL